MLDQARATDEAGSDRLFVADRLVFGADLSAYGDPAAGGRPVSGPAGSRGA